jgi:Tol biopolymer transport system component
MLIRKNILFVLFLLAMPCLYAQKVDYSIVSVPEEKGLDFMQITTPSDYVYMPVVKRSSRNKLNWLSSRVIDVSIDGKSIAYISYRNNETNIFIKELNKQGGNIQRTNRSNVMDFSYSPDGTLICFSERRGNTNQIFQTSASSGYSCRQITSGNQDYSPVYSSDMKHIFFSRQEKSSFSIWSYDIQNNFLSNYTSGINPFPVYKTNSFFCSRMNAEGRGEIWKINYETGVEENVISDRGRSFTSPALSPDGKWVLFVGSNKVPITPNSAYINTDIFAARTDGTDFIQITYHAADDLSPVWSKDGKHIYFISQRGNAEGIANIWRVNFNH